MFHVAKRIGYFFFLYGRTGAFGGFSFVFTHPMT
jgi:hypothetical protein